MKAVAFDYVRPGSVREACALLAADEGSRVLAGGQSLIPMLAMRLARPTRVIDIARIADLAGVRESDGALEVGAATRQAVVEHDPIVAGKLPLLAKTLPWVGHPPTRRRGTIGGSIAHGDPAAEIPLVAVALQAALTFQTVNEAGEIAAEDFYLGPMINALPEDAILVSVRFPLWTEGRIGTGFHEVSSRRSDFALVAAAAQVAIDADGLCTRLTVAIGGACDTPVRLSSVGRTADWKSARRGRVRKAVEAGTADLDTVDDLHASAAYRKRVGATLACRAILDAKADALGGQHAR